jgi:hypothetical protein
LLQLVGGIEAVLRTLVEIPRPIGWCSMRPRHIGMVALRLAALLRRPA